MMTIMLMMVGRGMSGELWSMRLPQRELYEREAKAATGQSGKYLRISMGPHHEW